MSRGLETEGSLVLGLLEPASWPCVCAQVNDGSHVVIWTACERTHNQYKTSCGFRPHPRECLNATVSIISLSIGLITNTNFIGTRSASNSKRVTSVGLAETHYMLPRPKFHPKFQFIPLQLTNQTSLSFLHAMSMANVAVSSLSLTQQCALNLYEMIQRVW